MVQIKTKKNFSKQKVNTLLEFWQIQPIKGTFQNTFACFFFSSSTVLSSHKDT